MFERNKINLAIAFAIIGLLLWYTLSQDSQLYKFLGFFACLNILFSFSNKENNPHISYVDNPLDTVTFSADRIHVDGETVELERVKKVVLELQDGDGILQLPYNNGGKINIAFPAKYLFKLKQQFKHHLPDVTYIS